MVKDLRDAIKEVVDKVHGLGSFGTDDEGRIAHHTLSFDSQQNQLEPIYYWVLDFMAQIGWGGPEKTIDNFTRFEVRSLAWWIIWRSTATSHFISFYFLIIIY